MASVNSLGRRKSSVARVILSDGNGDIKVNGVEGKEYFPITMQQFKLMQPFKLTDTEGKYDVTIRVDGGGITGQDLLGQVGAGQHRHRMIRHYLIDHLAHA